MTQPAEHADLKARIREAQTHIIDRLALCETLLADLYTTYRDTIPEMAPFWQQLANEEKAHEVLLKTMHTLLDKGSIFQNFGQISARSIDEYIAMIQTELTTAKRTRVTASHAISVALSTETALAGSHFYEVLTSDTPEFAIIAKYLSTATRKHMDEIQQAHATLIRTGLLHHNASARQ